TTAEMARQAIHSTRERENRSDIGSLERRHIIGGKRTKAQGLAVEWQGEHQSQRWRSARRVEKALQRVSQVIQRKLFFDELVDSKRPDLLFILRSSGPGQYDHGL